jgi:hypothetical protein
MSKNAKNRPPKKPRRPASKRGPIGAAGPPGASPGDPFAIDSLVRPVLSGGAELLEIDDPLEAEDWASQMLGMFYKPPVPLDARLALERSLGPRIVQGAERMRNAEGLAVLCALAALTEDEIGAREAARRMAAHGVQRPRWAEAAGKPEFLGGWTMADPFGDQIGYYLTFRYPDRTPHMVMALYDENLGGIIKDAFLGELRDGADPRATLERDPDVTVRDADPADARARIGAAIATGDQFLDNDWTEEFKRTRALLLARLRQLPSADLAEPPAPPDEEEQEALIQEFLASPLAPAHEETISILDHCMVARCQFGDGDPLHWSPIVVELFMLDYLPRKVTLNFAQIQALPEVLTAWVRFALTRRGLAERFIVETERAVDQFTPEFRKAVTDAESFGPAKAILNAMRAEGVDVMDRSAVDAWLARFNSLPDEARRSFFRRHIQD